MKIIKIDDPEIVEAVTNVVIYNEALMHVRIPWDIDDAIYAVTKKHELIVYLWQLVSEKYSETKDDPEQKWQIHKDNFGGALLKRPD